MDPSEYESLSRSELAVMRLLSREQEIGEIASALGLTPSTVETYIKNARRKLGGAPRYVAARRLREFEVSLNQGSPLPGLLSLDTDDNPPIAGEAATQRQCGEGVREERVSFRVEEPTAWATAPTRKPQREVNLVVMRLLMVVGIAFALAALLLLAIPLGEGAQRLANVVAPLREP